MEPLRRGYRTPPTALLLALLVVVIGAILYLSRRPTGPATGDVPRLPSSK